MFTVFGASGNTGSVVAESLLAQGEKVRVVARSRDKVAALAARGAEVFVGDVLDAASVASALRGAAGAYLLMPPDAQSSDLLARNRKLAEVYARAIDEVGLPHAVLLSSIGAELPAGTGPIVSVHVAEQLLGKTRAKLTAVRAAYFMENLLGYAHPIKADGVLPVFGGGESYPFPMVATRDIGEVAAGALRAGASGAGVIELSGPAEVSFEDAAREASAIVGRPVKATALPIDGMVPALTGLGFSANVAGLYREMTEAFGRGAVRFQGAGRSVRGKVTLAEVLRRGLG
ncbi:MAG: NmrA family NAD(P)-binding protein [Myxococcales bacterium]|jgi:uncharacterized protein YbjT (DUF2867 family)|nr:NmrA family NAD(P)-binding protein [Myxococcales bacterium]